MNANAEVMAFFPSILDRAESDALVDRIEADFGSDGFGLWALEAAATGEFVGFTGLAVPRFEAVFTPAIEVGWRLARHAWGNGYATEAARGVVDVAFGDLRLAELVSFTSELNVRSHAVMRRLGMSHDPADDFDHPALPEGHRLRRHVLYRINAAAWPFSALP
jgi:RimJ/RimL family protein N-acetyltransferase